MGTLMCWGRWWDAPGVDGLGELLPALPAHSLHVSHWGEPCWEKGLSSLLACPWVPLVGTSCWVVGQL